MRCTAASSRCDGLWGRGRNGTESRACDLECSDEIGWWSELSKEAEGVIATRCSLEINQLTTALFSITWPVFDYTARVATESYGDLLGTPRPQGAGWWHCVDWWPNSTMFPAHASRKHTKTMPVQIAIHLYNIGQCIVRSSVNGKTCNRANPSGSCALFNRKYLCNMGIVGGLDS